MFFKHTLEKAGIPGGIEEKDDAETYRAYFNNRAENKTYPRDLINMCSEEEISLGENSILIARAVVTNPNTLYKKRLSKIYRDNIQNTDFIVVPKNRMIPSLLTTTRIGKIKHYDCYEYLEADTEKMEWLWPGIPDWAKEFFPE